MRSAQFSFCCEKDAGQLGPFVTSFSNNLAALPPQRGGIAQLVERLLCKQNVWGSNPHASTTFRIVSNRACSSAG